MKKVFVLLLIATFAGFLFFLSCKKPDVSCEDCEENKRPIAVAGPDQLITLPADSCLLDGSASSDPDGTISNWLWTKISGPASFTIVTALTSKTSLRDLDTGVYRIELMVKDNGGLSEKDTVQIIVSDPSQRNQPPISNAGADQTITLPTNIVNLDGSGSTDPDNNITSYKWTKISGPSFNITNADAIQTQVNNLVQGIYQFELKVTDAGGLLAKDTVSIIVNQGATATCEPLSRPIINAQLIPFGNLSIARSGIAATSIGNKLFFAGGYNTSGDIARVDIYDIPAQTWSVADLSIPRGYIAAVAAGSKVFFAGGATSWGSGSLEVSSRVDIYDLETQTWSIAELSQARAGIAVSIIVDKVFFAGGYTNLNGPGLPSSRVDIFNISTQSWSTAELSEARAYITSVSAENKLYFGGGDPTPGNGTTSKKIDIYDNGTGTWSVSALNEEKAFCAGFYKNGKIYWAGGATYINLGNVETCQVEIKDINSQVSTFTNLFEPKSYIKTLEKDNKIILIKQEALWDLQTPTWNFDIYDVTTNSWSIGVVNQFPIGGPGSSISNNNTIYLTGGWLSNQVWKLEF